jgi:hypothetical protein
MPIFLPGLPCSVLQYYEHILALQNHIPVGPNNSFVFRRNEILVGGISKYDHRPSSRVNEAQKAILLL